MWAGLDSNPRRREPTDLQSVPFDRFGTDPCLKQSPETRLFPLYKIFSKCQTKEPHRQRGSDINKYN